MKITKQFSSSVNVLTALVLAMSPGVVKAKSAPPELAVRELVENRCGSCHNSKHETAKPAALKVFDLKEDDWTSGMSNDQLRKINGRFANVDVTPAQRKQVANFVKRKLAERVATKR